MVIYYHPMFLLSIMLELSPEYIAMAEEFALATEIRFLRMEIGDIKKTVEELCKIMRIGTVDGSAG